VRTVVLKLGHCATHASGFSRAYQHLFVNRLQFAPREDFDA